MVEPHRLRRLVSIRPPVAVAAEHAGADAPPPPLTPETWPEVLRCAQPLGSPYRRLA